MADEPQWWWISIDEAKAEIAALIDGVVWTTGNDVPIAPSQVCFLERVADRKAT